MPFGDEVQVMAVVQSGGLGGFQLVLKDGRTFPEHPDYAGPVIRSGQLDPLRKLAGGEFSRSWSGRALVRAATGARSARRSSVAICASRVGALAASE